MRGKNIVLVVGLICLLLLTACSTKSEKNTQIANPASEKCINDGFSLEILSDESGNQYGICIFPNGTECEEWSYFRGECK